MSASLVEMVLAISIAGLIFACALIPTTQTLVSYQEAELDQQRLAAHALAVVRAEQVAGSIWRDPNAPPGGAPLQVATASRLRVGNWELRARAARVEQRRPGGSWARLATPVTLFSFQYLLGNGTWRSTLNASQRAKVIAIRFGWRDRGDNRPFNGLVVLPDHAFSATTLTLTPPGAAGPYRRSDFERNLTFSLGGWR